MEKHKPEIYEEENHEKPTVSSDCKEFFNPLMVFQQAETTGTWETLWF